MKTFSKSREYQLDQAAWMKWVASRDPTTKNGTPGGNNCVIVKDYVDLSGGTSGIDQLLCAGIGGVCFVDLGHGNHNQDLIINVESGKVYVNGQPLYGTTKIKYLNDGSWGIERKRVIYYSSNKFISFFQRLYDQWLEIVYNKLLNLGLISASEYHNRSVWHLVNDDLPKGKIHSLNSKKVLDKGVLT